MTTKAKHQILIVGIEKGHRNVNSQANHVELRIHHR